MMILLHPWHAHNCFFVIKQLCVMLAGPQPKHMLYTLPQW